MIEYENEYIEYLYKIGIGKEDSGSSSVDSYISRLNSVSKILGRTISPALVDSEADVKRLAGKMQGKRSEGTLQSFATALRHYADMVQTFRATGRIRE